jgi:glycosyltransferase involved in cell wall biosynthesis
MERLSELRWRIRNFLRWRLRKYRWIRVAYALLQDFRYGFLIDRASWLAWIRLDLVEPRDVAILPYLDRAIAVRPTVYLRRRRAAMLTKTGEWTAAKAEREHLLPWSGDRAVHRIAILDGLLTETDPTWLPHVRGRQEVLEPVSRSRVLHLLKSSVPDRWSGYTIRNLHNLGAQRDVGIEPVVVTDIGWPREVGVDAFQAIAEIEGVRHYRLDRGPEYRRMSTPNHVHLQHLADALVPLVRELRPAILHAHSAHRGGGYALVALALRERFGIPVVYEVRGLFEGGRFVDERAEQYQRRLAQEDRILHEVDGVVAISNALADELVTRGVTREKITVIPNGIDTAALDHGRPNPHLRAELGLEDRRIVGYIGNLDMVLEGTEILISAVALLRARGRDDVAALIVGDGTRRQELELYARRLGVATACRFTGRVPHDTVANYYKAIDVFTLPRLDTRASRLITPIKPFEALALGRAVLVSDLPALREIVDPPNRGETAPVGDPLGLADAIEALVDDPDRRARMGRAGRAWVRKERTWLSNGPRYRRAYDAILGPLD